MSRWGVGVLGSQNVVGVSGCCWGSPGVVGVSGCCQGVVGGSLCWGVLGRGGVGVRWDLSGRCWGVGAWGRRGPLWGAVGPPWGAAGRPHTRSRLVRSNTSTNFSSRVRAVKMKSSSTHRTYLVLTWETARFRPANQPCATGQPRSRAAQRAPPHTAPAPHHSPRPIQPPPHRAPAPHSPRPTSQPPPHITAPAP